MTLVTLPAGPNEVDLTALSRVLDRRPHGLIVLATGAGEAVRLALWRVLAARETLYWVGPLEEKPQVSTRANCWLLECPLEERLSGFGAVTRRDAHAVHVIGPASPPLFAALVHGALSGLVVVAELEANEVEGLRAAAATFGLEATVLNAALLAAVDFEGRLELLAAP